jgi:nitroreductase
VDALEALHSRISSPRLKGDVGSRALKNIFKAALRAPDHGLLKPWRFLVIKGEDRSHLGELFARAELSENPSITPQALAKTKAKPLRAPMIVVGIACITEHKSVPEIEQLLSCGAAIENMMVAAHAQGVGAMWRTGAMAYNEIVNAGLGLTENERILGYLYLGQIDGRSRSLTPLDTEEYFVEWHG